MTAPRDYTVPSWVLNGCGPEHYGFDSAEFNPINPHGKLTPAAKREVKIADEKRIARADLWQVMVRERGRLKPMSPMCGNKLATAMLETVKVAIATGRLSDCDHPHLRPVIAPKAERREKHLIIPAAA